MGPTMVSKEFGSGRYNCWQGIASRDGFINELFIDQEPFGRWKFGIAPQDNGVRFDLQDVQVNGLNITDSAVFWDLEENRSAFSGVASMGDLAQTLPLWDYAPMMTSSRLPYRVT